MTQPYKLLLDFFTSKFKQNEFRRMIVKEGFYFMKQNKILDLKEVREVV
jgi:hypothetical protein